MDELGALYEKSKKEKAVILAKIAPHRIKEAEILKELAPLEADLREVRQVIKEAEGTRLAEVSKIIAQLAPSQKRMAAEGGKVEAKPS